MKSKLIFLVLLLAVAGGVVAWRVQVKKKQQDLNKPTEIKVVTDEIERTVDTTGEVTPLNRVEIKPPISGRIEQLLVDEGSPVKAGQIIGWMSSSDRAAILDAALAQGPDAKKRYEDAYKPTPIVAPLSGVIILKNVVVGETVDASIVLYAMSDRLIVLAQVDEADIGHVKLNLPARITLDAYPDQTIPGHVSQILYEGKNVSNVITYGVKIAPDKVPPFFRSQMTANVSLVLERKENALLLPSSAVHDGPDGKFVFVPGDEHPRKQPITTGIENGNKVEITNGLNDGDTVLVWQKKYFPQKAAATSPLAGGRRQSSGTRGK
jgi:macrolide-specific efflux system membrane fusion protein